MATTYLTRTFTAGDPEKWTWSAWVKRSKLGATNSLFSGNIDGNNRTDVKFNGSDQLIIEHVVSNSYVSRHITNRLFRDTSAYYHIVVVWDTGNASEYERQKFYINGVEENSWATETNCAQNTDSWMNNTASTVACNIGISDGGNYFDGCMSHVHYSDGYALAPTVFGETDATTGEWKIKTSPSFTLGTNGYTILKDGNTITDQSTNSNNFTLGAGTLTNTEDCPDDVFATLNPLQKPFVAQPNDFSNGNTSYQGNHADWQRLYGTIGAYKGKWFYEWKCTAIASYNNRVGWDSIDNINDGTDNYYSGLTLDGNGKLRGGIKDYIGYSPNSVQMSALSGGNFSFGVNDILGMALDRDNNTISIYKNGVLEVNAYSFAGASNCSVLLSKGYAVAPSVNFQSASSNTQKGDFNFGNGYFGTTAITSEGTNASGIGKFEYNVPANYTAFSTKGLNS